MARVFISHASEDGELAADVRQWLTGDGHEVFLDRDPGDGLTAGEEWEPRLYERLRWADAVVCLVTGAYRASMWCTIEAAVARSRGSRVIPLQVEPGVDHPLLRPIHKIDYVGDRAAARTALRETLRRIDEAGGLGWPDDRRPFPGLQPFDTDLHRAFFGRTKEVAALAGLLRSPAPGTDRGLVVVVGPSGCGKSSLVRAGLLPAMAGEVGWLTLSPFFPGRDPLLALAGELAHSGRHLGMGWTLAQVRERLAGDGGLAGLAEELLIAASGRRRRHHLLVVVDQLEELLTLTTVAIRASFAEAMGPALDGSVQVVATIRPESLPELLACRELAGLPVRAFTLRPLAREALPEVIKGPARLAGITVEDHLLMRLVSDTDTGEALPLLAFVLSELADGVVRGGHLSMRRYEELGGVHGALKRQADAALAAACAAGGRGRGEVIAGLLQLVTVDERGDPTRWRARRDELPEPVRTALDVFVTRRLLATDVDESGNVLVGVAHEAFLSAWPPLAEAVTVAASGLRARRTLEQAAGEWAESGRPVRRLWEGNQLAAAVDATGAHLRRANRSEAQSPAGGSLPRKRAFLAWLPLIDRDLVTDHVTLSRRAQDFLHSSIRRDRSRRRRGTTILSVLLAAAVAAAGLAFAQQREALHQQRVATSRELTVEANALRDGQPRISLMLSVEALRLDPSVEARESLLTTLTQSHYAGSLIGHTDVVDAVAFSPDGRTLATASYDRTAILWDLGDRAHPARMATLSGHTGPVDALAFSPDGRTLATASGDSTAVLWDLGDRAHPARMATLSGHTGSVYAVAFSPDGRTLATASGDGTAMLWDLGDRAHLTSPATLSGHTSPVFAVAFSPDGRTLATGSGDRTAILWDIRDHAHPAPMATLGDHADIVEAVTFSPDGRTLATASYDRTAILWDLGDRAHPTPLATLRGHTGSVYAVAFSPGGRTLATAGGDRTAILWDLGDRAHPTRTATLSGHTGFVDAVAFSPDGTLATASGDRTAILWDLGDRAHPARTATLSDHTGFVDAAAFSPDGRTLATAGGDSTAVLWDLGDRAHPARTATLTGHNGSVSAVTFSPDGRTLATASGDSTAMLWDRGDRAHPARTAILIGHNGPVRAVAFSPDGRTLATASRDSTAILWDLGDRAHPARMATLSGHTGPVDALAFSPDSRTLATAGGDTTAILWDLGDRAHPARVATLSGHTGSVYAVAFSPDGRTLATAGDDSTAMLWDLGDRAHAARMATLSGHTGSVYAVAFSPDGRALTTASEDGTAVLWDLSIIVGIASHAVRLACAMAGPALSRAEWAAYIPGMPYERICP